MRFGCAGEKVWAGRAGLASEIAGSRRCTGAGLETAGATAAALIARALPHLAAEVVGARQACQRVQQDNHISPLLHQHFGIMHGLLGDAPVLRQLLIEAGSIEFDAWPLYLRAPLGHFFRAFIHKAQK